MSWKNCFDLLYDCTCPVCERPDRCSFGHHRTANGDEEIAMEEGIVHSNGTDGTDGQVNGSNNHTGYTAVDAPRIDHHDDEDDSFNLEVAEEQALL